MANYSTNLQTWGATGTAYPTGYSYTEGDQPVDDWDNFLQYNSVEDIKHLINLTNKRLESSSGTSFPASPDSNHVHYRSDQERFYAYNSSTSMWEGLMKVDGDTFQGDLDLNNNDLLNVGSISMSGVFDLSGNDLKDSTTGSLIYDSSTGSVPLSVLSASDVTLTTGSHISGGGTISLGDSMSISLNDDFVENDGDILSGGLTTKQASGNNNYTAENTGTGDRLSLRTTSGDLFELVGYDSSDGSWDYGSSLEYNPSTATWNFNSLPQILGNDAATRSWVNSNADVPNADHADEATVTEQFEARIDYPTNPSSGQVVFRTDKT